MSNETYRKCSECGTVSINSDYCDKCGALINTILRRKLEREEKAKEQQAKTANKEPNAITAFFENARKHKNPIIRVIATIFYSIWMVVFMIGAFFAYIIGYIAA